MFPIFPVGIDGHPQRVFDIQLFLKIKVVHETDAAGGKVVLHHKPYLIPLHDGLHTHQFFGPLGVFKGFKRDIVIEPFEEVQVLWRDSFQWFRIEDEGFLGSGSLDAEKYYEQDCTKEAWEDDE